jgi:hypothetical protein
MKKVYLLVVAVAVSFALVQTVEAGSRGGSHSSSSAPHFSAPSYHSAPSRSYSSAPMHHYSAPRISSMPNYRSYHRNPTYTSNTRRFDGDRITAFNSQNFRRSHPRTMPNDRSGAFRSQGFDRGRVIARHNGNWNPRWDRHHDHWWHGHRCHYRNGFWFVYDPFPFYPFGYGYYPYAPYLTYYDDGYATDDYSNADPDQSSYAGDARVSDVQSALSREGYYDGPIDGNFGPTTRNALRRYQRDHRLAVTGNIDRAVIQALRLR